MTPRPFNFKELSMEGAQPIPRSSSHWRGGGPAEAWPRKLIESAREFPKAFLLAWTLRVASGGAGATACLPIDIFAVFDRKHVQPIGTDTAVENTIGPNPVGPDLLFLKMSFQGLAVERMIGKVTERFFHSFSRGVLTILEVFERLRCETDLPHCFSPNAALKE